jgi:hypothetical protein
VDPADPVAERAAADAAQGPGVQPAEAVELEQPARVEHDLSAPAEAGDPDTANVAQHPYDAAREAALLLLLRTLVPCRSAPNAPLQDEYPHPPLGESGGRHGTAEARAHDDDIVSHGRTSFTGCRPPCPSARVAATRMPLTIFEHQVEVDHRVPAGTAPVATSLRTSSGLTGDHTLDDSPLRPLRAVDVEPSASR